MENHEMHEYIEREDTIKRLMSVSVTDSLYGMGVATGIKQAVAIIHSIPAADVAPVVRCKDCVLSGNCSTEDTFRFVAGIENPFCCVGKRKEGAE